MRMIALCLIALLMLSCNQLDPDLRATVRHWQIPVLKNKPYNALLRVDLTLPSGSEPKALKSIEFSLDGSDDLGDLQALQLWSLGQDSTLNDFYAAQPLDEIMNPGKTTSLAARNTLSTGNHYFLVTATLAEQADLHHGIRASCLRLVLEDDSVVLPRGSSPIRQRIGVAVRQHRDDNVHTYRIPGLATTNKGTLLAIYDVRRHSSRDLQGDIDIGLSRSTDKGKSWERMRIILDQDEWGGLPEKFNGVSDACILIDDNSDKIFVAGLWMHGVLDTAGHWIEGLTKESEAWEHQWRRRGSQPGLDVKQTSQFIMTLSVDDGLNWDEPVNLTSRVKRPKWWLWAPAPGHGITMDDGTLVLPTQGRDSLGTPFSNITYSRDRGETWTTSNPAFSGTTENMVVQLSDGRLMINCRANTNRNNLSDDNGRAIATTDDMGQTWQEHPTSFNALIEPTCMASLHKHVYHENGTEKQILLFSNPNSRTGRHHTTIKVSFDDGMTWPRDYWLLLDEGKNRGYSCLTSIDEQTIGILYEGSQADMTFESIPLSELVGKDDTNRRD